MMKKKLICIISICLVILALGVAVVADTLDSSASDPTLLYEETFNSQSALPAGWSLPSGNRGSVNVADGKLTVDAMSGIDPVAVYYASDENNYIIETDFTVKSALNTSRWIGICFRVQESAGFAKASVGLNGLQSINYVTGTSLESYGYVENVKSSNMLLNIGLNEKHTLRVVCYGNNAAAYLDGVFITSATLASPYDASGDVGVCLSGMNADFDAFRMYKATEPGETNSVDYKATGVYIPKTGIVNPPVAASASYSGELPPAVLMLSVAADGSVTDYKGASLGTLDNTLAIIGNTTIPAYKVDSEAAAALIADFINKNALIDAFAVVKEADHELIRIINDSAPSVRGIIEVEEAPTDNESAKSLLASVNTAGANVVLFRDVVSRDVAFYLQKRMLTVWTNAKNESDIYSAIASGVNGIVADNADDIYAVYETFDKTTVIRQPIISAHKGVPSLYPENTLRGYQLAYELGADVIEIDIRVTKDKKIVLIHDDKLDNYTDGTGLVASYTLDEIKNNYNVDVFPGVLEKIPTLEETFAYFSGKDIVFMLDMKIYDFNFYALEEVERLVREYNMEDQCVIMSDGNEIMLREAERLIPDVARSYGSLNQLLGGLSHDASLVNAVAAMSPSASQPFPYWYNTDGDWSYLYEFSARGWLTWASTTNSQSALDERALDVYGASSLLTDYTHLTSDYIYAIEANNITVKRGEAFTPEALVIGRDGAFYEICFVRAIGDCEIRKSIDSYVIDEAGVYTLVPYVRVELPRISSRNIIYFVYGAPITVTVSD